MNVTLDTLFPFIISLVAGFAVTGYLYYVKSGQISPGRVVIWMVWIFVIFGLLGLLATKIQILPYTFTVVALCSTLLGVLYILLAQITLDWWQRSNPTDVFVFNLALLFLGLAGFSIVYMLLSGSGIYLNYLMVAIVSFLLPALLFKSHDYWMQIPRLRYKTWSYPIYSEIPRLQPIDPIKLMMNFTPVPSGKNGPFESYEVEFPTNESLSDLFHYFISFHNKHREYRKKPIQYLNGEMPLEWVLFKYSSQKKRLYLDMDKTLIENQIAPNEHIYAASSNVN